MQGGTLSSTGSWLPSPPHLAAHTRAELCCLIRNICSPEARACIVTPLGQAARTSPLPQLCIAAGMGSTLQPHHGTPATSGTGDPQGLQSKLTPPAPIGLNQLPKVKVTKGTAGQSLRAWPLPHRHREGHSSAPPAPSLSPGTARGSAPSQNSARQVTKTLKNPTLKKTEAVASARKRKERVSQQ